MGKHEKLRYAPNEKHFTGSKGGGSRKRKHRGATIMNLGIAPEYLRMLPWYLPHQAWLREQGGDYHDPEQATGKRADLCSLDLSVKNLAEANLPKVNLWGARLCRANLTKANLSNACFVGADLSRANFAKANLYRADIRGAYLHRTSLYKANLSEANFTNASLCKTYLPKANLLDANLLGADFSGASLEYTRYVTRLPVGDPRGYDPIVAYGIDGWLIYAGCQRLTLEEAKKHWGLEYSGDRYIGDLYLRALDWLESGNGEYLLAKWYSQSQEAI